MSSHHMQISQKHSVCSKQKQKHYDNVKEARIYVLQQIRKSVVQ